MTSRIPRNGRWYQANRGEITGDMVSSLNLDLKTNPGKLRLSARLTPAVKDNDASISNMGVPIGFAVHDVATNQYWAACGIGTGNSNGTGTMIKSDDDSFTSDWDNDALSNTPTDIHLDYSDMVRWDDSIVVSTFTGSTSRFKRLTTTWDANYQTTAGVTFQTGGGLKNLCVGFNGNLYFTDDDEVNYITTADSGVQTGAGTLDFAGRFRAIWIRSTSDYLWIGLMDYDSGIGSKGYVAQWDATGTSANRIFELNAPCALSATVLNDVLHIIDAYGVLKRFNGGGFIEVARLPVANLNIEMPGIYSDLMNTRWVHQRGMEVVDGRINISVNNYVSSGVYVNEMPSGIWEYVESDGINPGFLYHKESPCADSNDYGQQMISVAGALFPTKRSVGTYLAGFGYYTDNGSTERKAVFYDEIATNTNKRGTFTTPFIYSSQIRDSWQEVDYRFKPLPSGDKIIGKFRTEKHPTLPFLADVVWTSTTTFTSTDSDFANASVGDEVEVVMGKHASTSAHITTIAENAGTYTITLEDTIGSSSGNSRVRVDNFKKLATISTQNSSDEALPIGQSRARIQIKTEVRFTGNGEMDDLTLVSETQKKIK